jgi:formate dehydrogenase iron-sulfur subunit
VIGINPVSHTAQKCTLCHDRLKVGLVPACAQACPTQSIQFGPIRELRERAAHRVDALHARGQKDAWLYGADEKVLGGLNSFYLLVDRPEVYGLPPDPQLPTRNLFKGSFLAALAGALFGLFALVTLRRRRERREPPPEGGSRAGA